MTSHARHIVISPHLDDAVLSCYPIIKAWLDQGIEVEIWTVMAGVPAGDTPFSDFAMTIARRDPVNYAKCRKQEDTSVACEIGVKVVHLPFLDAPFRSDQMGNPIYTDMESITNHIDLRELHLVPEITEHLQRRLRPEDTVVSPSALAGHVDHLLTRIACELLQNTCLYYDEFPYSICPGLPVCPRTQREWLRLINLYSSQMEWLFPSNILPNLLAIHHPKLRMLPKLVPRIPRVVHIIWIGDAPLPPDGRRNLDSWAALLGPTWTIRLWTNSDLNEKEFPAAVLATVHKAPHGVQKADILRYHIMSRLGGWYFDMDFSPIRSIETIALVTHRAELILCNEEEHLPDKISNGFFACCPEHPAIKKMAEVVLTQPLNTGDFDMGHIATHTGPTLFYKIIGDSNAAWLPTRTFYPVTFSEIVSESPVDTSLSFARHVWDDRYLANETLYFNMDGHAIDDQDVSPNSPDFSAMLFCFVRNEPYLLSRWIPYHANLFGLNNIMVIDHGSGKETASILDYYMKKGLHYYNACRFPFSKKSAILTRIMRRFKHCRFLIPLDADEFICAKTEMGMDCSRTQIHKALKALPDRPLVYKFGMYDACNRPDVIYNDPLHEMTKFKYFPSGCDYFHFISTPSKSFFPGEYFISTDDGNHTGKINPDHGVFLTTLALAHFHTRGYHHFLLKHANASDTLGVTNMEVYIRAKGPCYHWIIGALAIKNGEGEKCFHETFCSEPGLEERAISEALKRLDLARPT